jgi:hypothetical protein
MRKLSSPPFFISHFSHANGTIACVILNGFIPGQVSQKAYRGREYTRSELDDKIHTREDHPKSMSSPFCSAVPRVLSPTFKAPVYEKELHLPNGHNNKFPLPSPQASLPQLCPQPYSARKSSAPSTPFLGEEHTRILMEGVKPMSTSYQYSLETKFDDVLVETNEHAEGICSTTLHSTQSVCRLDESFQVNRQRLSESSSSKAHNHTLESDATTSTNMTCSSCHASCTALSPHKRLFAAVKGTLSRVSLYSARRSFVHPVWRVCHWYVLCRMECGTSNVCIKIAER